MDACKIIQVARKLDIRLYSAGPFETVACKLYDYVVLYGRFLVPVRAPRVDNAPDGGKCANYRRISRHTLELKFNFVERKTDCGVSAARSRLLACARLRLGRHEGRACHRRLATANEM